MSTEDLNIQVSYYKNLSTHDRDRNLIELLYEIRDGRYKDEVNRLRLLKSTGETEKFDEAKKKLPAFTTSATFRDRRKPEFLRAYNSFIVLDLDKIDSAKILELHKKISECEYTFSCFKSPGGLGLKIIVRTNSLMSTHKDTFLALQKYYENHFKIKIDPSGKDLTRLCFMSYDQEIFINQSSKVFEKEVVTNLTVVSEESEILFEKCKRITERTIQYIKGSRNNYIHHLASVCNRNGIIESETLNLISTEFDLPQNEIDSAVASAYKRKEEHNTKSSNSSRQKVYAIDKIENFILEHYEFRYNIIRSALEFKTLNESDFLVFSDYHENSLLRKMQKNGIKGSMLQLKTVLRSDFSPKYDPFMQFFENLPPYDGMTDYLQKLSSTVKCTNQEFWELCFKKWFVALVGSAIDAKTINHTTIVFSGKQGIGKTTWINNLIPEVLKDYVYSGAINPDNKDTMIHLSENILINLDELESLNKSEIGALKEIITKDKIKVRLPYGRNAENFIRRASFIGSVNVAQFLNDTTGSRRFLCFEILEIDSNKDIDILNAYAQALHLYLNNFQFWFDKKEILDIEQNNDQFQVRSAEEELLLTWCRKPEKTDKSNIYTTTEIAAKLEMNGSLKVTTSTINKLGRALNQHSYSKIKKDGRQVWEILFLEHSQVESNSIASV